MPQNGPVPFMVTNVNWLTGFNAIALLIFKINNAQILMPVLLIIQIIEKPLSQDFNEQKRQATIYCTAEGR